MKKEEDRYPEAFHFDCPHCPDPRAQTQENFVDIHAGTLFHCASCGKPVIFVCYSPQELAVVLMNRRRPPQR